MRTRKTDFQGLFVRGTRDRGGGSYSRAVEICKTQQHQLRVSLAARCPSYPPWDASGTVRERQSWSHPGEEGTQRNPPLRLPSLLPRSLRFPRRVVPIISPAAPYAQRQGRAGRCPAGLRPLSGQRPARPVPREEAARIPGERRRLCFPLRGRPAPRTRASEPPSCPRKGRPSEGRGGPGTLRGGGDRARPDLPRTHLPRRGLLAAPGRSPPSSARPAPAPSFSSPGCGCGSPRHPGNAAPRRAPPSSAGGAGLR